jgi:hypothetical protein
LLERKAQNLDQDSSQASSPAPLPNSVPKER